MTTQSESFHDEEFLLSEANGNQSREEVTIVSGAGVLVAGTVLGKITSGGKYDAYDQQAGTGIEAAAGILCRKVDATDTDVLAAIIKRNAEVKADALTWPDGSPTDITAGVADLLALGIIVRD